MKSTHRRRIFVPVAIVAAALVCLAWVVALAPPTPEPAAWRAARGDDGLLLTWYQFVAADDQPRFLLFRLAYLGLLQLPGSDFGRFGIVMWLLAAATLAALAGLLRRTAGERGDPLRGGVALTLVAWWIFSPAFGADWLVGARFGIFVPPLLLLLGVRVLGGGDVSARRVAGAGLLAWAAIFFDRTGVLVWIVLAPWVARQSPRGRRTTRLVFWVLIGNVASLLSYLSPWEAAEVRTPGLVLHIFTEPWGVLVFLCEALGDSVPRIVPGFGGERLLAGLLLGAGAVWLLGRVIVRRHEEGLLDRVWPWVSMVLFGAGVALVQSDAYFAMATPPGVLRELGWGAFLLPVGLLGGAAVLTVRRPRTPLAVGALVVGLLLAADWHRGWEHMKIQRALLHQAGAQMVFARALGDRLPDEPKPALLDQEQSLILEQMGYLRGVRPVLTTRTSEFAQGEAQPEVGGIEVLDASGASGFVRATTRTFAPDLVLVCIKRGEAEEEILRIAAPHVARGGKVFPWAVTLDTSFEVGDEVRCLGFHAAGRRAYPLRGRFTFTGDGFRAAEDR